MKKTDLTTTDLTKTDLKKSDKKADLKKKALKQQVSDAIHACQEKKAEQITVLELEQGSGAFTDYFVVCSGTNPRQIQAISDEVEIQLKRAGQYPNSIEGYKQAEWVLIDYVDFVVHIFSETARKFYDLERLWKSAKKLEPAELVAKPRKKAVAKKVVRKKA
jgi:ribosome-associated protein